VASSHTCCTRHLARGILTFDLPLSAILTTEGLSRRHMWRHGGCYNLSGETVVLGNLLREMEEFLVLQISCPARAFP